MFVIMTIRPVDYDKQLGHTTTLDSFTFQFTSVQTSRFSLYHHTNKAEMFMSLRFTSVDLVKVY